MADGKFGMSSTSENFKARAFIESDHYRELEKAWLYLSNQQHLYKTYDFDGRIIGQGLVFMPDQYGPKSSAYIPLRHRRPSTPYRLGSKIIKSFSDMVFGEGRWPELHVEGDEDADEFLRALIKESNLPTKMKLARNIGGAVGTVGMSWGYVDGVPIIKVHNGKSIIVHEWADEDRRLPSHVSVVYRYEKSYWDSESDRFVTSLWWHRMDWTMIADIVFVDVPDKAGEPYWEIDNDKTVKHHDGFCHFVYILNHEIAESQQGVSDLDGQYDALNTLDILNSVLAKGAILNVDPTLKLKMDPDDMKGAFIRKGSDNAIVTGTNGDASYMELAGTGLASGATLLQNLRKQILETTQCVIPDSEKVVAAGTSAVALKIIYAPMLAAADSLREMYGTALVELLRQMLVVAQRKYKEPRLEVGIDPETGEQEEIEVYGVVKLSQKLVTKQIAIEGSFDPITNEPLFEEVTEFEDLTPGEANQITISWGTYFNPTATDIASTTTSLLNANGGKAIISQETTIEIISQLLGIDSTEQKKRLEEEAKVDSAKQNKLFDNMGGSPGGLMTPEDTEDEEVDEEPINDMNSENEQ